MTEEQKTGLNRNITDKFYTKPEIVNICIGEIKKHLEITNKDLIIEPSAGNGAFIEQIKELSSNYKFYDILPENDVIIKQDFLEIDQKQFSNYKKIHIIGNPPFGRQSSAAIKFIKKSCEFSDSISFILPKSFKKESLKRCFSTKFHLIFEIDLPKDSFLVNGEVHDVPCIFQIWKKMNTNRKMLKKLEPLNYKFVNKGDNPNISFRRVGVNAGKIDTEILDKSPQSHYFIKFEDDKDLGDKDLGDKDLGDKDLGDIIEKLKNIKFDINNTVGPKSISKQEVISQFNSILGKANN